MLTNQGVKPLRALIVHRDEWYRWEPRIDGLFSYPVPQFTWTHWAVPKAFKLHLARDIDAGLFDVIWLDDGKYKEHSQIQPGAPRVPQGLPPVIVYALYPTLTEGHFRVRLARAKANADAVMVDHDRLDRWRYGFGGNVRRCAYAVNDRYYRMRGSDRDIDVGFYYVTGFSKERIALDAWLKGYCTRRGWRYVTTLGRSAGTEYASLLARTKVVVHLARSGETRPPRIFDSAACGAAFLGNPIPDVSGEYWADGVHYYSFVVPRSETYVPFTAGDVPEYSDVDCEHVAYGLDYLLDRGHWRDIAEAARQYVMACHTWQTRAVELYGSILDMFPHLRDGREAWQWIGNPGNQGDTDDESN